LARLLTRLQSFIEQGAQQSRVLDAIDFLLSACYDRSTARERAASDYVKAIAAGRDPVKEQSQQGDTLRVKNLVVESLTLVNERGEKRGEFLTRDGGRRAQLNLLDGKGRVAQMLADDNGECGFTVLDQAEQRYPVRLGYGNPHFGNDAFLEIGDSTKADEASLRLSMNEDFTMPLIQVENADYTKAAVGLRAAEEGGVVLVDRNDGVPAWVHPLGYYLAQLFEDKRTPDELHNQLIDVIDSFVDNSGVRQPGPTASILFSKAIAKALTAGSGD
jgi:hypothetical protein